MFSCPGAFKCQVQGVHSYFWPQEGIVASKKCWQINLFSTKKLPFSSIAYWAFYPTWLIYMNLLMCEHMRFLHDFLRLVSESSFLRLFVSEVIRISFHRRSSTLQLLSFHFLLLLPFKSLFLHLILLYWTQSNMTLSKKNINGVIAAFLHNYTQFHALHPLFSPQTARHQVLSRCSIRIEDSVGLLYSSQGSVSSTCFLSLSCAELIMGSSLCLVPHQHHKWFSLSNAAWGSFKSAAVCPCIGLDFSLPACVLVQSDSWSTLKTRFILIPIKLSFTSHKDTSCLPVCQLTADRILLNHHLVSCHAFFLITSFSQSSHYLCPPSFPSAFTVKLRYQSCSRSSLV